jgi:aryl-alcohol dehydrogenase-like predicted oxidoreductase
VKQVQLGQSGLRVSTLCLGTMTFGDNPDGFMAGVAADEAQSLKVMHAALDAGINFWDTADIYGNGQSEQIVGRALKDRRGGVVLATKCGFSMGPTANDRGMSRRHILAAAEASLRRLGTDYVDLYQVHFEDRTVPPMETLEALDQLVRDGKVRYLGASNYTAYGLTKAVMLQQRHNLARFISLQPHYNLLVRDVERELLSVCRGEGLGIIPWSPLASGFLSGKYKRGQQPPRDTRLSSWSEIYGKYGNDRGFGIVDAVAKVAAAHHATPAQVALAWVMAQPGVTSPIIGARTLAQLQDNLGALKVTLSAQDLAALDAASALPDHYPADFLRSNVDSAE